MPYHLKKSKSHEDGYYVYGPEGKHSKEPLSLAMAKKQMVALNIAHARKEGADIPKVHHSEKKVITDFPGAKTEHKYKGFAKKTAHAVEAAHKFAGTEHQTGPKYSSHTGVMDSKAVDKAAKVLGVEHSPAGMVAPVVSETTGGGSGLANDSQWVEHPHRRMNAHHKLMVE
jgi:hypothetical protein